MRMCSGDPKVPFGTIVGGGAVGGVGGGGGSGCTGRGAGEGRGGSSGLSHSMIVWEKIRPRGRLYSACC